MFIDWCWQNTHRHRPRNVWKSPGDVLLRIYQPGERPLRDGNNFNAQSEAEIDIIASLQNVNEDREVRRLTGKYSNRLPFTCIHFWDAYTRCIYKRLWSNLYWNKTVSHIRFCTLLPLDKTSFNFCCWNNLVGMWMSRKQLYIQTPEMYEQNNGKNYENTRVLL